MQAQAQTYDGYIKDGAFYPRQNLSRLPNRYIAMLTIVEVPATVPTQDDDSLAWLDELEHMIRTDNSPKLRMEDFPRLDFGREPIVFSTDNGETS